MDMTVRECIKEMRKICDANSIYTNNRTEIRIDDIHYSSDYIMSKIKVIDGEVIFRRIFCYIVPNKNTKGLDLIKQYNMRERYKDSFYRENEYYILERELNRFISINDGIDRYRSIDAVWYMWSDIDFCFN